MEGHRCRDRRAVTGQLEDRRAAEAEADRGHPRGVQRQPLAGELGDPLERLAEPRPDPPRLRIEGAGRGLGLGAVARPPADPEDVGEEYRVAARRQRPRPLEVVRPDPHPVGHREQHGQGRRCGAGQDQDIGEGLALERRRQLALERLRAAPLSGERHEQREPYPGARDG
ncbi:MAG: hypothetical protein RML12_04630 [Xanthomonadales bacterium]|nr:hypothetical protein [Xanthomonadales bacterium]